MLTVMNNLGCLIFLFLPNVKVLTDHPMWANWALVAACVLGCIVLFPFAERYRRTDYDEDEDTEDVPLLKDASLVN